MYGSFPEISVSARFFRPMWRRTKLFLMSDPKRRLRTVSEAELNRLAAEISDKYNLRPRSGAEAPVTLPG
jgi:hypothetical protein